MKRWLWLYLLLAVTVLIGLPWLWQGLVSPPPRETLPAADALPQGEVGVRVYLHETKEVKSYPLEEAVARVVASEVPASFPAAALEAQAIVARTYILSRLPKPYGTLEKHPAEQADICDDYHHCQAFYSGEELADRWGGGAAGQASLAAVTAAVTATQGQVLLCAGKLTDPVYHSTCGGKTEAAADCWQSEVPALQSVTCGFDTSAPKYASAVVFSEQQLVTLLGVSAGELAQLAVVDRSDGNRVSLVTAGEKSWSGRQIRQLLGLNSANFSFVKEGDTWLFTVLGFGHGVGLCQYGAKGMAAAGYDAQEILHHYYQKVEICPWPAAAP